MQDKQISRFPIPNVDELPADIKKYIYAIQEKIGFIPNVFLTLSYRPDEFRAFIAYHDAVMERKGGLTIMEFLEFTFSSIWHFLGILILIGVVGSIIPNININKK